MKSSVGLAEMIVESKPLPEEQMLLICADGLQVGECKYYICLINN